MNRITSTHQQADRTRAGAPADPIKGYTRGFTLIELMITLTIAVILIAIAIPSFNYMTVSNKLTTTANDLVTALGVSRSEAIKRNVNIDLAADGEISVPPVGAGTKTVLRAAITVPPVIQYTQSQALVATPMGILQLAGAGAGYTGLAADINSSAISSNNHRCVYVTTGAVISSCTDNATCAVGAPNANCK